MNPAPLAVLLGLAVLAGAPLYAQETLILHYYERPPYAVRDGSGRVSGLTANPAAAALNKAGIVFIWQLTPARRQLELLRSGKGLECGLGWLRTPEREAFAQFSRPLYRDQPPVVIARASYPVKGSTLPQILADSNARLLTKDGLIYSHYISEQIQHARVSVQQVSAEQPQLVRMLAADRADLMFAPLEEAAMLSTSGESGSAAVKVLAPPDIPIGETRHLMCSRRVSSETMARLDAAIEALRLKL